MPALGEARDSVAAEEAVVSKAVVRAAERLGLSNRILARTIGISEASVSRMSRKEFQLSRTDKAFELALLLIRVFRSLDAIAGGDEASARMWLHGSNATLGEKPIKLIQTVPGLVAVLAYLDAHRAVV